MCLRVLKNDSSNARITMCQLKRIYENNFFEQCRLTSFGVPVLIAYWVVSQSSVQPHLL